MWRHTKEGERVMCSTPREVDGLRVLDDGDGPRLEAGGAHVQERAVVLGRRSFRWELSKLEVVLRELGPDKGFDAQTLRGRARRRWL